MKRFLSVILLLALAVGLYGCGDRPAKRTSQSSQVSAASQDSAATSDQATTDSARKATRDQVHQTTDPSNPVETHPMAWRINTDFFKRTLKQRRAELETEELLQTPELPTGCESVALTAALRCLGFTPDKTEIADNYLSYGEDVMWDYVGDPYDYDGAGVFPPGLTNCANNYLAATQRDKYAAYNTMGVEFENLLKLIDNGFPVVLWTTMDYEEPMLGDVAYEYEGEYYYWFEMEHCVLLYGYDLDEGTVMLNDPMQGTVTMDLLQMKTVYDAIGRLSMTIKTKE